ncbi:MAG TPA: hypothetical protein VE075_00195 [Thermoanaerobaculia bacterium]|nr:hypothetical protein [Thermoanaerobaculia bacterium]
MLVLAIYNLKGNEALLARELAAILKRTVYETISRVRAPGGGPSVIASFADREAAQDAAAMLRSRGFDLLLLDGAEVEADQRRFVVRGFELGADAMTLESRGARLEVRYQDVDLLLRGIKIVTHQPAAPRATRQLSLTRAALTGGLLLTKTVQGPRRPATEEREGFLHLYGAGLPPLAWRESEIRYNSLGGALQPSRQANFAQVAAELRRRCPQAAYDDRLASRAGQAQLLGPTLAAADHLDLAISVLAAALRQPAAS